MSTDVTLYINDKPYVAEAGQNLLNVCQKNQIDLPSLCYFEGLSNVGACRLCLIEIEGNSKLIPACTTPVSANQKIKTNTERLKKYRRMTLELFFAERNHICSVCIANQHCELQNLAYHVGMEHVRFPYLFQDCNLDASHEKYVMDHNRCIMCTRCVRVCDELEGAHNWDVMGRGFRSRIISDFNQPWGESTTCTSCGKCLEVCPTGALWPKDAHQSQLKKNPMHVTELIEKKKVRP